MTTKSYHGIVPIELVLSTIEEGPQMQPYSYLFPLIAICFIFCVFTYRCRRFLTWLISNIPVIRSRRLKRELQNMNCFLVLNDRRLIRWGDVLDRQADTVTGFYIAPTPSSDWAFELLVGGANNEKSIITSPKASTAKEYTIPIFLWTELYVYDEIIVRACARESGDKMIVMRWTWDNGPIDLDIFSADQPHLPNEDRLRNI